MTNWYTSDLHFGHSNIIDYCNRPFASVAEMDEALIANCSSVIEPDDNFWILGDFALGEAILQKDRVEHIFDRLPGKKHLVLGNHDGKRVRNLPWESISDIVEVKDGDHDLVLCHYPMITWHRARRGALQLFGHVHQNWRGTRNSINVGADVWDYRPVRLEDVLERAKTLPVNKYWSDVEHGATLE